MENDCNYMANNVKWKLIPPLCSPEVSVATCIVMLILKPIYIATSLYSYVYY